MMHPRAIFPLFLLSLMCGHACAGDGAWSAGGGGSWENPVNWSGGTIADGSGAKAAFTNDPAGDRTVTLESARTIGTIVFGDDDTDTPGAWSLAGPATLTLAVPSGAPNLQVNTLADGQTAVISAALAGAAFSKSGAGTLVLSGNNNFSSPTLTFANGNSGIVRIASTNALNGISTVTMPSTISGSVSRIELEGNVSLSADLTTAGRGAFVFLRNLSGNNAWNGSVSISNSGGSYAIESHAGTLTLGPVFNSIFASRTISLIGAGDGVAAGIISNGSGGRLSIAKTGAGNWKYTAANSYSGTTEIGAGILEIATGGRLGTGAVTNNGMLSFTSANDLSVANAISGNGAVRIAGSGNLTLGGNSSYAGGTTVSGAGNLSIASNTGLGAGPVTLGDTPGSQQIWFQPAGDRTLANDFEIRTQRWIIDGNTINGKAPGDFTVTGAVHFNQSGAKDIYLNRALTLAGTVTSTGGLTKLGGYQLTISGAASYPGVTSLINGATAISGSLTGGPLTVGSGATLTGGGSISGAVNVTSGATLVPGNDGSGTLATGPLTLSSGAVVRFSGGASEDPANTRLAVTGNLTLNGEMSLSGKPGLAAGYYMLATYSGALKGPGFQSIEVPGGFIGSLVTSTPGEIGIHLLEAGPPTPANNIMLSMENAGDLTWFAPADVTSYDVYFGASSAAVAAANTATSGIYHGETAVPSYDPGTLANGAANWWRIDYRYADGTVIKGPVWNFTLVDDHDLMADTWVATDGLDRVLPGAAEAGPPRDDRPTAIFYFLWHNKNSLGSDGPRDNTKEIQRLGGYTDKRKPWADDPKWMEGGSGRSWYWGEPEAGYYSSNDEWVIRRHIMLLTAAGVDILAFDNTNGNPQIYEQNYTKIAETIRAMRREGMKIDLKFMFLTHAGAGGSPGTVTWLYDHLYKPGLYPEMWLMWDGKPAVVGYPDGLDSGDTPVSSEVRNFFTWRTGWANVSSSAMQNEWQWIDSTTPQNWGYSGRADIPEQVPVACGGWCNGNLGRSYYNRSQPAYDNFHLAAARTEGLGRFFSEQMAYGLKLDPKLLFVTGWNEWWAGAWTAPTSGGGYNILDNNCAPGQRYFVDAYTAEYSRDIEPMKGGFGDNYYYQLVAANRLRKGVRTIPFASPPVAAPPLTVEAFGDIGPVYRDAPEETLVRNAPTTFSNLPNYTNTTGRNDFRVLKVARDASDLYFYAETKNPITAATGSNWMNLYIDTDGSRATGWEGYDYVINHGAPGRISKLDGPNWDPVTTGSVTYTLIGNKLIVRVSRAALGLGADPLKFDFHWTDNIQTPGDIADFGASGDSAPERRFNYRYQTVPIENVILREDGFENGQQAPWGETFGPGSQWHISGITPYTGGNCLIGAGAANTTDASGTLINRTSTAGLESFQVRFRYKLANVKDAQDIRIYYRGSNNQWIAIRELGRDEFHASGQAWGYDERQNVWLEYSDSRINSGADSLYFHNDFAIHIQIKSLTLPTQTFAMDDFRMTGTRQVAAPQTSTAPTPANGASGVAIDSGLAWTPGAGGDTQHVYFGTTENLQQIATLDGLTNSHLPVDPLDFSTNYAWRIDTENAAGVTPGPTWNFTTVAPPNSPPTLEAIPDFSVIAGQTIDFTTAASDPENQALSFALTGPPAGAGIDPQTGMFHWRPAMAQAPGSYPMTVTVHDDGDPPLSAQRDFTVHVAAPAAPTIANLSRDADGTFRFQIQGDAGPDYRVWVSGDLATWDLLETVLSPQQPFWFEDAGAKTEPRRFYRLEPAP